MNVAEILPGELYAGGKLEGAEWVWLADRLRVRIVINVRDVPDTPGAAVVSRMKWLWYPLHDRIAPPVDWLFPAMAEMNNLVRPGNAVYVHDTSGINRLGFILVAFMMTRFGMKVDEALAWLCLRKPNLHPQPWYMAVLYQYERLLGR